MSNFYRGKRKGNIFDPQNKQPYRLSRTKVEMFLQCPRCFYLDRRLGADRPPSFPFTLNSAVDLLLKKEFDSYRSKEEIHPLMKSCSIDAVPFQHNKIDEWRDALHGGITYLHQPTNFLITGAIDDLWINRTGELHIVDYKATAKTGEIDLDADWQNGYKRQAEIYQWLFRQNAFKVSKRAYFLYCNGDLKADRFDQILRFGVKIIPYDGNDSWVEQAINEAHKCLMGSSIPASGSECDFCLYRKTVDEVSS